MVCRMNRAYSLLRRERIAEYCIGRNGNEPQSSTTGCYCELLAVRIANKRSLKSHDPQSSKSVISLSNPLACTSWGKIAMDNSPMEIGSLYVIKISWI